MEQRNRIIEEARHLFLKQGIKSMTMSDIANHMGISKRTLYEQFQDKEELLEACLTTHNEQMCAEVRRIAESSENLISIMMRMYAQHLNDTHQVNKTFIYDLRKYYHRIYQQMEQSHTERLDVFMPVFQKGIDEGLIRDDINLEVCLWLMKSQFRSLMVDDFMPTDRISINEFARVIILNFVRGIATPKGYTLIDETVEKLKEN
ncbi:MAG: TetR/AcrR family transcriptional regulator [Candidatus Symbiothrix sp.]|jgi:AcrR family transcriptional regulator|nr:TetR/AcrR family transcriptional regulator [Candidatus Symbiothrix sp.]